nr:unnamed protein product [Spirometra erinaceieuropaei]
MGIIILVTMTEGDFGLGQPSDIYRSIDNGKSFQKITQNLGEKIYIKRENGLQTRKTLQKTRKIYVICQDETNKNASVMFSTSDAGDTWEKSKVDFILSGKLKFSVRDPDSDNILTLEKRTNVYGGRTWRLALNDVHDFTWSGFSVDDPGTIYALHRKTAAKSINDKEFLTLSKSVNFGRSWKSILTKVRKMWVPESIQNDESATSGQEGQQKLGRFLYAMHFNEDESKVQLSVSDDGGLSFKRVYLPTVAPERFFHVLEVEDDFVFLHVDEPDEQRYCTFSVVMLIAAQRNHKVCGLQISNQFSMRSRVIASPPLATSTARGLILAHGHVSTHLKNTPADGYVSSDGGYTWRKAFDGPHHYQIANRGGLIVAVPADTLWVDVLRFSTDEGRCWHTIPLTYSRVKSTSPTKTTVPAPLASQRETEQPENSTAGDFAAIKTPPPTQVPSENEETVVFTGLVTEPGGQAMTVAVYGYGTVSQRWRVAVVDFSTNGVITRNCTANDYEVWSPHEDPVKGDSPNNGCLLGMKEFFYRLKEDSLCFTDANFHSLISSETCECTEADYECEYGYWRQMGSTECVPNPHAPDLDVCELSEEDRSRLHELGYRRIPGNRCTGGWEPPRRNQTITRKLIDCPSKLSSYLSIGSKITGIFVALTLSVIFLILLLRWRFRESYTRRHIITCPFDCKRLMRWPRKANVFHSFTNGDMLANEGVATISFSRPTTASFIAADSTLTDASNTQLECRPLQKKIRGLIDSLM